MPCNLTESLNLDLAAERAGKYKTVSQIFTIAVILAYLILRETSFGMIWPPEVIFVWLFVITFLMFFTVFLTLVSGVFYIRNYKSCVYAR